MPKRAALAPLPAPPGPIQAEGRTTADALAASFISAIADRTLKKGRYFPPLRELSKRHGVAIDTIRKAFAGLVEQGYVEAVPSVGYRVLRRNPKMAEVSPKEAAARAAERGPIGILYGDLAANYGASRSIPAIEALAAQRGRAVMLAATQRDGTREDEALRRLLAAGVQALIVAPATEGRRGVELERWIRAKRPAVLEGHPGPWTLRAKAAAAADHVDLDNAGGMHAALEHCWSLGHRRFALLCAGAPELSERAEAWRAWLDERGVPGAHRALLGYVPPSREGGAQFWRGLHERKGGHSAVLCTGDEIALGVIDAARAAGVKVPQDLSVVGFGNESADGPYALRELTTVDYDREHLAHYLLASLDDQARALAGKRLEDLTWNPPDENGSSGGAQAAVRAAAAAVVGAEAEAQAQTEATPAARAAPAAQGSESAPAEAVTLAKPRRRKNVPQRSPWRLRVPMFLVVRHSTAAPPRGTGAAGPAPAPPPRPSPPPMGPIRIW